MGSCSRPDGLATPTSIQGTLTYRLEANLAGLRVAFGMAGSALGRQLRSQERERLVPVSGKEQAVWSGGWLWDGAFRVSRTRNDSCYGA